MNCLGQLHPRRKNPSLSLSSVRTNVYLAWKSYFFKYISSTHKYLSIYTSTVCSPLLSIVLPAAVASAKSALNVWFQIQEDEQQIDLNKHLRDAGITSTKPAGPPDTWEPPHKSEAMFFLGKSCFLGTWPPTSSWAFNLLKLRNRADLDLEAHAKSTSVLLISNETRHIKIRVDKTNFFFLMLWNCLK